MKDFTNVKKILEEKGNIKTKELKELGYSTYDINLFLDSNLLTRTGRGLYSLPAIAQENAQEISTENKKEEIDIDKKIAELCKKGTYEISKRFYAEAEKYFYDVLSLNPNHDYAYYCLSMISATKKDYASAYDFLKKSIELTKTDKTLNSNYMILTALSYLTEVDEEFVKEVEAKLKETSFDDKTQKYFYRIMRPLKREDFEQCRKKISYFIYNDIKTRKYHINNNFIELLLNAILEQKRVTLTTEPQEEIPKAERPLSSEASAQVEAPVSVVIVPEVNEDVLVANTLLLECISKGDYEKAKSILENNSISNQNEVIEALLSKLISVQAILFGGTPTKVISVEPVRIIDKKNIDKEVTERVEVVEEPKLTNPPVSEPAKKETVKRAPVASEPKKELTAAEIDEKINDLYLAYKQNRDECNFVEARRNLVRYELLYKQSGKYRNIKYHYDALDRRRAEYQQNPEQYLEKEAKQKEAYNLILAKKYEEALSILESIKNINPLDPNPIILIARIKAQFGMYEVAYNLLKPYDGICEEPSFFRQMAQINFNLGNYEEALENCFNYNERRPRQSAIIYMLMADCYRNLHKSSKELKILRVVDEINLNNGKNIDLSSRINSAESQANRQHDFKLAKINKRDVDYD